jgi:glyoxylase-like metal-dependent hydrolase (beta-lactamase superfamily II)
LIEQFRLGISNVFLVKGERALLVDSGRASDFDKLLAVMRGTGVRPEELSLILHTHAHWDHCGGALRLREMTGVRVAVHRADAEMMRGGHNGVLRPTGPMGVLLKPFLDRRYTGFEADILLDDEMDLRPYGIEARVIATPGHTAGSVSVLMADGEAIIGDLLMGGYAGGVLLPHRPTLHYYAEDLAALRASVRKVLTHAPHTIRVGHGGPLRAEAVRRRFG